MWNAVQSSAVKKASQVSLTMTAGKRNNGTLIMSMPSTLGHAYGFDGKGMEFCEVFVGDGEHAGRVLYKPAAKGPFKIARMKFAISVRIAAPEGWPIADQKSVVTHEKAEGGVVVTLPAWAAVGAKAEPITDDAEPSEALTRPGSLEITGNTLVLGAREITLAPLASVGLRQLVARFGQKVSAKALLDPYRAAKMNVNEQFIASTAIVAMQEALRTNDLALVITGNLSTGWKLKRK